MKTPDRLQEELTHLLSFHSTTAQPKNCKYLLLYVQHKLQSHGLLTQLGSHNRHPYLLARLKAEKPHLLLQAHIDVVPGTNEMFQLKQRGDQLIGRGVYDMLFATACYLVVVEELATQKLLSKLNFGLLFTSDEEVGGFDGCGLLASKLMPHVCFLPDAGTETALNTASKGVLQIDIEVHGHGGHAGRPNEYDNPIVRAARIVTELERLFPNSDPSKTVCALSIMQAGETHNQVPTRAYLGIDVRYVPADEPKILFGRIDSIAQKYGGQAKQLVCEPAFTVDVQDPMIKEYQKLHEKLRGQRLNTMHTPGSSDARFFSALGIPVIMHRPAGGGLHGPAEWISAKSLLQFYEVLKEYVVTFKG